MARTVLPIAGAIIGAFYGNPYAGYAIGAAIAGVVDPINTKGPRIGETGAQTSQEGAPRAIVYGTCQVTGNVIASGPLIKRDVKESQGKGGGTTSTEHAYRSYAVRISEGPVGGFLRFWEDDKLVYDVRVGSTMLAESEKWAANKVFYLGDEDQLPDPTLQMLFGTDEVPAHRGSAYFVVIEGDLTDRRGSIPQYRVEVASQASYVPSPPVLGPLQARVIWRAQTYSALYTAYGDTEEEAVWASGRLHEGAGGFYQEFRYCTLVVPESGLWQCYYVGTPYQDNFDAAAIPGKGPASGYTRVTGTAKQLADVIYDGDTLIQEGLGPVLLPGDADYDNASFWSALRDAAISAGDLSPSSPSPVVVAEYGQKNVPSVGAGEPVPLSDIVTDIHARCNFPAGQFDVSELTDQVSGLVLAGEYTGADAINTLRSLYLFDAADQDKMIVYPKRGKPVVATITEDDIVEAEESTKREQAIEYPKKLHLSYQNAVGGYAVAKATSARSSPDVRVVGEVSTSVPVVLSPDQAAQAASIMHKIAWAEAEGETKLSVPLSWIKYIASDCFGVALRGRVTRERMDELNTADGVIEYTLRRDRQSAYTSSVTGIPIPEPTPPPSTIVGETVLAVIDISPRTETEDDLHYLVAATGGLPAWNGAVVQRSLDYGANYSNVASVGRGMLMGTLVNDLADASELYTDTTNVLRVQLYRDSMTIEELTEVQFLSEGGAVVIMRPDGSSEVLQYRDATEVSPGVYDLSHLHRGQLNSGTSAHLAGSLFVGLADALHISAQSSWINSALWHRAVSGGEAPETADEQVMTYEGRSQIEWPVSYLSLARAGSTVTGAWAPRHRFGSDDAPVASANFRGYLVTLDDGVLPAVSFETVSAAFSYDASALGSPLTVSVAALNRITGAGPSVSESI